jgi:hypothetical protein
MALRPPPRFGARDEFRLARFLSPGCRAFPFCLVTWCGHFSPDLVRLPGTVRTEGIGHNSNAVHRAYAKRALMKIPSLEDYEQRVITKNELAT